ncbi:MAG: hypothetical protein E7368_00980 [Clostridiales bacterium]|nr:hypothetical protein [Clostridiales bacterium]
MPIGKNAIKRVENNGYSNVKTSAPDMENSNVIANLDPQVMEKMVAPVEQATEAKVEKKTAKKAPAKKAPAKKTACKKAEKNGFERVSVCDDMPYYLL